MIKKAITLDQFRADVLALGYEINVREHNGFKTVALQRGKEAFLGSNPWPPSFRKKHAAYFAYRELRTVTDNGVEVMI